MFTIHWKRALHLAQNFKYNEKSCLLFTCIPDHSKIPLSSWSEVAQSCLTLCNAKDCNLPGSSSHGIFQLGILEWVVISFSRRSTWSRNWTQVSHSVGRRFTVWATSEVFCFLGYSLSLLLKKWKCYSLSLVWLFVTPWTVACQIWEWVAILFSWGYS